MARTLVAADDFSGTLANFTNLMTAVRGNVIIDGANQRITGEYAGSANDHCIARYTGAGTITDNQYASMRLATAPDLGLSYRAGVCIRQGAGTGAAATGYEAVLYLLNYGAYITELALRNGASYTVLYSAAMAWAASDLISLEGEGTTLRLCKNATPLGGGFTLTDSTLTTGKPGVIITAAAFGDDFECGNITGGGGGGIKSAAHYYNRLLGAH